MENFNPTGKYLITVSSFYKALYAKDKLAEEGIESVVEKVPVELAKSCSNGIYLEEVLIDRVMEILAAARIAFSGVYEIYQKEEKNQYKKIA